MTQQVNNTVDTMTRDDWGVIARNPKFRELHRRKAAFLIGWWLFSTVFYFCLPVAAGYATDQVSLFNKQIIGHVSLGYLFALSQYALCLIIALYYAYWANKTSDRLTRELLSEIKMS